MSGRRVFIGVGVLAAAAMLVAGATASSEATSAGGAFKIVGKWGKVGTGNSEFNNVFGLATDKSGRVYVADSDNSRIQIFSSKGAFQGKIPFGEGVFPPDVAVDPDGNVWGTTDTEGVARQFTRDGRALTTLTTPKGAGGIAVDAAGNVYVVSEGDDLHALIRYDKGAGGGETFVGGFEDAHDVEVSADGSLYVSDNGVLSVKRFSADGKPLKTIKAGLGAPVGIGVDLDCNLWWTNPAQRRLDRYSPSGRLLGTAASPDLIAQDVVVGPTGDVYAYDLGTHSVIHFAENKAKPATANVPGTITVSKRVAKISYTLSGVACPSVVDATATLTGPGISGKAAGLKLRAGAKNTIQMKLGKARSGKATFKIVLQTNGRPTTETRSVTVNVR